MLRLKTQHHSVEDAYLALPDAQPLTLLQVANENLPYACQCPLCGGVFEIPQGTLFKIEEDNITDIDSGTEPASSSAPKSATPGGFFESNKPSEGPSRFSEE